MDKELKKELNRKNKKIKTDNKWIIQVIILSFIISLLLSIVSELFLTHLPIALGIILYIIVILIGILFDIVGVSVTSANEAIFHSMNSRKIKGAKLAVRFKKNANKVSNFCCDVIGDVCGIISGSIAVVLATSLSRVLNINLFVALVLFSAITAALTIGGKALGKSFAINKSNLILFEFAKLVSNFYHK
ncbi:MAG: hypothetical protein IJH18_03590 [Bacilli bacterium]|nr:hypothetical protein [Bacilli bacterium]